MKLLHTSDFHLGHRLHEQSQFEEQSRFLLWLQQTILENGIDFLLISGDIFDSGAPSAQSMTLYYNFLVSLKNTSCKHIVITGGNHDAPGTLNAPKELLQALDILVVGKAPEDVSEEVFELEAGKERVIIAAVPYLRDQDIRRAVAGESFDEIGNRYKQALLNHYRDVATHCENIKKPHTPVIAMGHLFANGGTTSDSEQTIYVGNLGDIGAADFPDTFDYVALGHLHRPQIVEKYSHIRYSGSPYTLSFSEVGHRKKVIVLETKAGTIFDIREIEIPQFRSFYRLKGTLVECLEKLQAIDQKYHELNPWVEVILNQKSNTNIGFSEVQKAAEDLHLEVLKVTFKTERRVEGLERLLAESRDIKTLSPIEVFKRKCQEAAFDLDKNPQIFDAFNEAFQIAKKG